MQMLRKKFFPFLLLAAGILLAAAGLFKMWQGNSLKVPLSSQRAGVSENTEKGAAVQKDTSAPSSNDNAVLPEKFLKSRFANVLENKGLNNEEKALYPDRPAQGDKIGTLTIPSLKMSLPIYEGTEDKELEKGVGHYAGSVLPGEADNCVLSGHRDTVFSGLQSLKKGDSIIVKTSAGIFTYRIRKIRIVEKEDTTVIVPRPAATLTLTTCYPFTYIGSAPQRYIISAYLK